MEEIRDYFVVPTVEGDVCHVLVTFRVNEPHGCPPASEIETPKPDLQREKEKFLSILSIRVYPAYCRAPFVCYRPQTVRAVVPFG